MCLDSGGECAASSKRGCDCKNAPGPITVRDEIIVTVKCVEPVEPGAYHDQRPSFAPEKIFAGAGTEKD